MQKMKLHLKIGKFGLSLTLGLLSVVSAMMGCTSSASRSNQAVVVADNTKAAAYDVVEDQMGNTISIGVGLDISEAHLRTTLERAANDHQDDAARDYLGNYLLVEAYLTKAGKHSSVSAGTLKRFVPLAPPAERKRMKDRNRGDVYTITLSEARQSPIVPVKK